MLTTDEIALHQKDMYEAANKAYKEKTPVYPEIYTVVPDTGGLGDKCTEILGATELDRHTAEDQAIRFDSPVQSWSVYVAYQTYSKGVYFSKNHVERTTKLGNRLKSYASTWGRRVRESKETWAARPFNNGGLLLGDVVFNGTHGDQTDPYGNFAYDNNSMFTLSGDSHTNKNGTGYYNALASTNLTPENFETLYNLMTATNNRDEQDTIFENDCDTLLTEEGANYFKARRILLSERLPGGQLNDLNIYKDLVMPKKWAYLSGGAWYVGKKQHPDWKFHEVQKPDIRFYRDENTRGYFATIDHMCGVECGNWRAWHRASGSYA